MPVHPNYFYNPNWSNINRSNKEYQLRKKTMERKQIIENLKVNERAYMFLSYEEKEVLNGISLFNKIAIKCLYGINFIKLQGYQLESDHIYRIKEDYIEEESKPKYLEIPIQHGHGHQNMFVAWKGMTLGLHKCCNYPAFIGFKFNYNKDLLLYPIAHEIDNENNYTRLIPTHAVFLND